MAQQTGQQEVHKTLNLMVGVGEAPNHKRAKTLLTMMFGSEPTVEELKKYRQSLHIQSSRRSSRFAQEMEAEKQRALEGDPFEGLV